MPFNASYVFEPLPSPDFPAVAGTVITSSAHNNNLNDIFDGLTAVRAISSTLADLTIGVDTTTQTRQLLVGGGRTGNGTSRVRLFSDATWTSGSLEIERSSGQNGTANISQRGTGTLSIGTVEGGVFSIFTTNTERGRVDPSGRLLWGSANATGKTLGAVDPMVQTQATTSSGSSVGLFRANTAGAGNPFIVLARNNDATAAGVTALGSGFVLGEMDFAGSDGADLVTRGAAFRAITTGVATANRIPTALQFFTAAGAADDDLALRVAISEAGSLQLSDGSDTSPGLSFISDTNTGIRRPAADTLSFVTAGAEVSRIDQLGRLILAHTSVPTVGGATNPLLHLVQETGDSTSASVTFARFVNDANSSIVRFGKSRGTTAGSFTIVQNNDTLGDIVGIGADGVDLATVGSGIRFVVDGTPAANRIPSSITFRTSAGTADDDISEKLRLTGDGRLFGTALHNNAGAVTGTTNQYIASGTYTPTLTNGTNVAATTAYVCQWLRVGNVVTVSGRVDVDPTGSGLSTNFGMSLPIASNFTASEQLGGSAIGGLVNAATAGYHAEADTTNDRANFQGQSFTASNHQTQFTFTYLIL